jgi:branched-chain amino acid transport system ATP-binding protein
MSTSVVNERPAAPATPRRRRTVISGARMPATVAVVMVVVLAWAHSGLEPQTITIAATSYALLAIGFNMIAGFAGRLAFGNTIFFGIGAYTVAAGDVHGWFPSIAGLAISVAIAAPLAYVLSRLLQKSAGLIFALITFTMSIMLDELVSLGSIFGGPQGLEEPLSSGTSVAGLNLNSAFAFAVAGCILVLIAVVASRLLLHSNFGRQVIATRDEPLAAQAAGVNTAHVTALMWAASAVLTAIAGVFYVKSNGFIDPDSAFGLTTAVTMIAAAVIGGLGSVTGPLIGGALLGAALLLNNLPTSTSISGLNELAYGAALIVVARLLPGGIVGTAAGLFQRWHRWPAPASEDAGPAARAIREQAPGLAESYAAGAVPAVGAEDAPLLEVSRLGMSFGGLQALSSVDLSIRRGEIVGLVGPNGAGKSTLFNCINGSLRPTTGEIVLAGHRVERLPAFERARAGLGRTFQISRVFATMSAYENIAMPYVTTAQKAEAGRLVAEIAELLGIQELMDLPVGSLSIVDQRRVELARAVAAGRTMIMLDEPTAGLDDEAAATVGEAIRLINSARGVTFVIVEHIMGRLEPIAHRLVAMDFGEIIADGTPADVLAESAVARAYLGTSGVPGAPADSEPGTVQPVPDPVAPSHDATERPALERPASARQAPALTLSGLRTGYQGHIVLHDVGVELAAGSSLGIIGPNGAGKTTLLRAISGETQLYGGEISVGGTSTARMRVADIASKLRVAHVVEGRGILRGMTVEDNLLLGCYGRRTARDADFTKVGQIFPRLLERMDQRAETMSGGEQQMLAIARALMMEPVLLLLDEPSQGLSPKFVEDVFGSIREINRAGVATIIVEQAPGLLHQVADNIAFMAAGRLSRIHPPTVLNDNRVIARLLAEGVMPE